MRDTEYGQALVERVNQAIAQGRGRHRLERWFQLVAPPGQPLRVDVAPATCWCAAPDREPLDRVA